MAKLRNKKATQNAFLAAYEKCGAVLYAARATGIDRQNHYEWMRETGKDADNYRRRFKEAKKIAIESLEVEARRRAVEGVNEPVIYKGELAGIWVNRNGKRVAEGTKGAKFVPLTIKKYSDVLLMCLMNANNPKKFRPRKDNDRPPEPERSYEQVEKDILEYLEGENDGDGSV